MQLGFTSSVQGETMRPLASVIIACAIAVSLGSCSDEKPPPVPPTTATTPANPDATPPPMPQVAEEFSAKGAATFVKYYVNVLEYASSTGDVAELGSISDPTCEGCTDYIDRFRSIYDAGGHTEGQQWNIEKTRVRFYPAMSDESFATTTMTVTGGTIQESSADSATPFGPVTRKVSFGLRYDDGWRVTQFAPGDVE